MDHAQRRAQLADAAIRLMVRDGLDAVTVRGVAAEAGWSTGSLRHYFADQRELQQHSVRAATDALRSRVLPRVQRPRSSPSAVERIALIVEELLPLDAARREEYALWAAITEYERRHRPTEGSRTWQDQRALYRQCIALLRSHETVADPDRAASRHPDSEVEAWAALLHTFVDGLASQIVDTPGQMPPETARSLLRFFLRSVPDGTDSSRP
ncbi:MAG: TetR/AcrR family transcriptional regulator [Gemmatimonadota bacterium]|nr:TetR/AcrR family transcriptional regulator [Gemmatimonadota bacterium]